LTNTGRRGHEFGGPDAENHESHGEGVRDNARLATRKVIDDDDDDDDDDRTEDELNSHNEADGKSGQSNNADMETDVDGEAEAAVKNQKAKSNTRKQMVIGDDSESE